MIDEWRISKSYLQLEPNWNVDQLFIAMIKMP